MKYEDFMFWLPVWIVVLVMIGVVFWITDIEGIITFVILSLIFIGLWKWFSYWSNRKFASANKDEVENG